jgi:hypothetical protein
MVYIFNFRDLVLKTYNLKSSHLPFWMSTLLVYGKQKSNPKNWWVETLTKINKAKCEQWLWNLSCNGGENRWNDSKVQIILMLQKYGINIKIPQHTIQDKLRQKRFFCKLSAKKFICSNIVAIPVSIRILQRIYCPCSGVWKGRRDVNFTS